MMALIPVLLPLFPVPRTVPGHKLLNGYLLSKRMNPGGDYSSVLLQGSGAQEADLG